MKLRIGLLLLLLPTIVLAAGAVSDMKRNFVPGMTRQTRERALTDLAESADPDAAEGFEWALKLTRRHVLELAAEKDDATEELGRLEKQLDDLLMSESERARREGRAPGPISIPVTLQQGIQNGRQRVEQLQRDIQAEYDLRGLAAEMLGGWIEGLPPEDRADALEEIERRKLKDRDRVVRVFYVKALGATRLPESTRLLMARLVEEDDRHVLPAVLDAVAGQAGELALDLVLAKLADERWQVRTAVIAAAARIGSPLAIPVLIDHLRVEDGRLRGDVAAALKALTGQDLGLDPDRWQKWWDEHGERVKRGERPEAGDGGGGDGGPGASFYGIRITSKRILFVIDISNSMNETAGKDRSKVEVAKYELRNALLGLPDGAEFNIVFYNHEVSQWRKGMVEASSRNRKAAVEFVEAMVADGNTNIYDALDLAFHIVGMGARDRNYELGADTIFFLSDGIPNRGKVTTPAQILAEVRRWNELRRVRIHAVGVGPGHDAAFMRELAESSGGTYVNR